MVCLFLGLFYAHTFTQGQPQLVDESKLVPGTAVGVLTDFDHKYDVRRQCHAVLISDRLVVLLQDMWFDSNVTLGPDTITFTVIDRTGLPQPYMADHLYTHADSVDPGRINLRAVSLRRSVTGVNITGVADIHAGIQLEQNHVEQHTISTQPVLDYNATLLEVNTGRVATGHLITSRLMVITHDEIHQDGHTPDEVNLRLNVSANDGTQHETSVTSIHTYNSENVAPLIDDLRVVVLSNPMLNVPETGMLDWLNVTDTDVLDWLHHLEQSNDFSSIVTDQPATTDNNDTYTEQLVHDVIDDLYDAHDNNTSVIVDLNTSDEQTYIITDVVVEQQTYAQDDVTAEQQTRVIEAPGDPQKLSSDHNQSDTPAGEQWILVEDFDWIYVISTGEKQGWLHHQNHGWLYADGDTGDDTVSFWTEMFGEFDSNDTVMPYAPITVEQVMNMIAQTHATLVAVEEPDQVEVTVQDLTEQTTPGDGWYNVGNLGWVYVPQTDNVDNGWIFHESRGWMYVSAGTSTNGAWFWTKTTGWFWSNENVYPYVWDHNNDSIGFVDVDASNSNTTLMFNFSTNQWELLHNPDAE